MRVWVGIILVLAGLAVGLYPEYQHGRQDARQKQLLVSLADWRESSIADTPLAPAGAVALEPIEPAGGATDPQIPLTEPQASLNESGSNPSAAEKETPDSMGIIEIPKIKLKLPILEGVGDPILNLGAGHFPETALPGKQGNTAIAAHRSYRFGRMFNRLNELELYDQISISEGKQLYRYQVTEIKVVEPDATYVLNQPEKGRYLTLVTCEPILSASHRLIVRAVQLTP